MAKQSVYSDQDRNINNELYSYFLTSEEFDGWDDRDKFENFRFLVRLATLANKPLRNSSVLDVGCGTGDMAGFLKDYDVTNYVGIDIFEPAIQLAKNKFPNSKFLVGDFLTKKFGKTFDFVFCSGAISTNLHSDNYEVLESWLKRMWQISKYGLAFNFLSQERSGQYEDDLFLYDARKVIELCTRICPDAKFEVEKNRTGDSREYLQVHIYLYR